MDEFLEKWHSDKKYQAKIKLLGYAVFIVIVTLFAASQGGNIQEPINDNNLDEPTIDSELIDIPDVYSYTINITINDKQYTFTGNKNKNDEIITKTSDESIENFMYRNDYYYKETDGNYIKTSRNVVYEPIDYEYIDLENINLYLSKAKQNNGEYFIYIKDIILNSTTDEYFVINRYNNRIDIDYTSLMKQTDPDIYKYIVNIEIIKE